MKKIYVVGSLNMDLVIETPYMPQAGETLKGRNFATNAGGKGANQAMACGRLGGAVSMCGVVGNDAFGETLICGLQENGVDVKHIRKAEVPTGVAMIILENGDNRIILDSGANAQLTCADIDTFLENAQEGDIFLIQLESPIEVVGYGLQQAKERKLVTVLNPAPGNRDVFPYLKYVDIITPNQTELEIMGGLDALLNEGISYVITTLGGDGFEITGCESSRRFSCIKVKAVDTTAAGDTLCGGLVVGLAEGKSLDESAAFGSKAASIACTRYGAQKSIPTRQEVENY